MTKHRAASLRQLSCLSHNNNNKYIEDDMKAAARRSPNCIWKTKKIRRRTFSIWLLEFFPLRFWPDRSNLRAILNQVPRFRPNWVTCGGVMTSHTISRWRPWRFILLPVWKNKRPPYWNFSSGCYFDHIMIIVVLFRIRLSNFVQILLYGLEHCKLRKS